MLTRTALPADACAIDAIHTAAFGGSDEARLVAQLEADGDMLISLVAEVEGQIIGHIAFSWMHVVADARHWRCASLGPVSVVPERQLTGVGSALIAAGLNILRTETYAACFVLGDTGYYSRFGFDPALARPFASPYAGPHFMALYLDSALGIPQSGSAAYAPAFGRLD